MATPPDFTSGQILTAAQMNAVGLWLVKTDTITNAASKTVTDAFSADYDAYKVVLSVVTVGAAGLRLTMGATTSNTSGWFGAAPYWGKTATDGVLRADNTAQCEIGLTANIEQFVTFDIYAPYLAANTHLTGSFSARQTFSATFGYSLNNTTSYTSFTLACSSGSNLTSGNIYVYGYNK